MNTPSLAFKVAGLNLTNDPQIYTEQNLRRFAQHVHTLVMKVNGALDLNFRNQNTTPRIAFDIDNKGNLINTNYRLSLTHPLIDTDTSTPFLSLSCKDGVMRYGDDNPETKGPIHPLTPDSIYIQAIENIVTEIAQDYYDRENDKIITQAKGKLTASDKQAIHKNNQAVHGFYRKILEDSFSPDLTPNTGSPLDDNWNIQLVNEYIETCIDRLNYLLPSDEKTNSRLSLDKMYINKATGETSHGISLTTTIEDKDDDDSWESRMERLLQFTYSGPHPTTGTITGLQGSPRQAYLLALEAGVEQAVSEILPSAYDLYEIEYQTRDIIATDIKATAKQILQDSGIDEFRTGSYTKSDRHLTDLLQDLREQQKRLPDLRGPLSFPPAIG